jgi:hypothetical protein
VYKFPGWKEYISFMLYKIICFFYLEGIIMYSLY